MSFTTQRAIAIAALTVLGSTLAFAAGAKVGAKLDHQTRTVQIARMPIPTVQAPDPSPAVQVANR